MLLVDLNIHTGLNLDLDFVRSIKDRGRAPTDRRQPHQ